MVPPPPLLDDGGGADVSDAGGSKILGDGALFGDNVGGIPAILTPLLTCHILMLVYKIKTKTSL